MTTSGKARAIAAAGAVLACVLCLWRHDLWFQQVTAHQAGTDLATAAGLNICNPFAGDAFHHTPWSRLWPFLAITAAVVWMPGFIGYALSFGALGLVAWRYVMWGFE